MKGTVFYYHPLSLNFTSAQTIQVVRDYLHLSRRGYDVHLYGYHDDPQALAEIGRHLAGSRVQLHAWRRNALTRPLSKLAFLRRLHHSLKGPGNTFLITRTHRKSTEALRLRKASPRLRVLQEFHEEAFAYLFKKNIDRTAFFALVEDLDGIVFTTPAQRQFYEQEAGHRPARHAVLPNGVEIERFRQARHADNGVLTYLGQFNAWKNVELLFAALARLGPHFTLRIAGGKGDETSRRFIEDLRTKYGLPSERIDYRGFVHPEAVVEDVLDQSQILLLPLGDNLQSRYLTSPMKLFEYMATGIPVLAVDHPSTRLLASNGEIWLAGNDPQAFAGCIEEIVADATWKDRVERMNALAEGYSYENRSRRFDEFLQGLAREDG